MRVNAAHAYTCTQSHTTVVHLDCVAVTEGPRVCGLSGSAWVRARVQCTMVGALHHSASWLDRPWLWGPSRTCWAHSNCALLRKGFCILLMDYSPTSPVRVDSFDRQTHTSCRHVLTRTCTTSGKVGRLHQSKKDISLSNPSSHKMQSKQRYQRYQTFLNTDMFKL